MAASSATAPLTRGEHNQQLAADLEVDSVAGATDPPPEPLDDIPKIQYDAELFHERRLRSVTADTRQTGPSSSRWRRGSA